MPVTNYYAVNGRLIGEATIGVRTDYLTDALGNVTATVDQSQAILNTYRYKPHGDVLSKTGVAVDPKYRWVGQYGYRCTQLGFATYYIRSRSYSSATGTWTTIDSEWPEEATYQYANGNPVTWIDYWGTSPCQDRTNTYCREANKWAGKNWGFNCFCRVSSAMCLYLKFPCSSLRNRLLVAVCERCKPWVECVNKCLFDCVYDRKGCFPSANACWDRTFQEGGFPPGYEGSPCIQIFMGGCIRWEEDERHYKCCRSMVFCEQEQLGYCNGKTGPCGKLDNGCSKLFSDISKQLGLEFPFDKGDPDRQYAAYRLCCRRKVWSEDAPGLPKFDKTPGR